MFWLGNLDPRLFIPNLLFRQDRKENQSAEHSNWHWILKVNVTITLDNCAKSAKDSYYKHQKQNSAKTHPWSTLLSTVNPDGSSPGFRWFLQRLPGTEPRGFCLESRLSTSFSNHSHTPTHFQGTHWRPSFSKQVNLSLDCTSSTCRCGSIWLNTQTALGLD